MEIAMTNLFSRMQLIYIVNFKELTMEYLLKMIFSIFSDLLLLDLLYKKNFKTI